MFRIPLPFTDAVLLLSPRWGELRSPGAARSILPDPVLHVGLFLLIAGLLTALVLLLYRYELRLIRKGAARGLLSLRLIVVLFVLFMVCLQPVVARSMTEELPGRVLVAVDRSDSMEVADPQRPPADKLRLARALRLAADICPDAFLDDWIGQYDQKKEAITWVGASEKTDDPARRRDPSRPEDKGGTREKLEEERRRWHDQVCQRVDQLTRSQIGQKVLLGEPIRLMQAIQARHKVEWLGFQQETWDVPLDQPEQLYGTPADSAAGAQRTDLRGPLVRALERTGPDQGRILGVVLLTDGQHNEGPPPVAKALEMGKLDPKIPIYPLALGSVKPPPDVALVALQSPAAVFKDVDTTIEARFRVSGIDQPREITVELRRPGQPPMRETIRHDGKDRFHTVRFRLRLDKPGTEALTVAAEPIPGEIHKGNNNRSAVINVADDRARLLLIDGEARWEFHYLATAMARDRTIQLQSVVFHQPRVGVIPEEELRKVGHPALALPAEADALAAFDGIILGDVTPAQLPPAERTRLEKYVADRGGTLVMLAGKRAMPMAYRGPEPVPSEDDDPLLKLLPIEEPRVVSPARGFPVQLTDEGKRVPFLQLEATPDESLQRWAALPRHYWGVIGRAKPGAVPFASFLDEERPALPLPPDIGTQARQDRDRENALMVRQHYGFGRVLYLGLDSTWRWRWKVGDSYHHRFWGQLARWAASDKPLVVGNDTLRFGTREAVYRQGREVDVVVRLGDEVKLRPDALAGARIFRQEAADRPEETIALVPLKRKEAQPRVLEGQVRDLAPGAYAIELAIPELADKLTTTGPDGQPAKLRSTFSVTPSESEEMLELSLNQPLLEDIASKSGGKVFTPENARELVDLLTRQSITREFRTERKLWQEWGTLLFFLLLLTAEWVGRKLAGLP